MKGRGSLMLELFHSILIKDKRLVNGKPCLAMKLALAKAYDRISWKFIDLTLKPFRFPESIRNLIMICITTVSIAIRFNGCLTDYFKPSKGLRQGDPLSPLIFNLCMAQLSLLISDVVSKGKWVNAFYQSTKLHISNMLFVDGIVFFWVDQYQ